MQFQNLQTIFCRHFDGAQSNARKELQVDTTPQSEDSGDNDEQLFVAADFEKNELGF